MVKRIFPELWKMNFDFHINAHFPFPRRQRQIWGFNIPLRVLDIAVFGCAAPFCIDLI
jgi:hypothetical protein